MVFKRQKSISAGDRDRITQAIRQAEQNTGGEIYVVLAQRSDDYFFAAGYIACCGMIVAAVIAAFIAHWTWIDLTLPLFGLALLGAFISVTALLALIPRLRMILVPRRICYRRAHLNALQQFIAHKVHLTRHRTGILLFVSLAERYAEVVADEGISTKVGQEEWNNIVSSLLKHASEDNVAEGFIAAITQAGALLAVHIPRQEEDFNELGDHLIEL